MPRSHSEITNSIQESINKKLIDFSASAKEKNKSSEVDIFICESGDWTAHAEEEVKYLNFLKQKGIIKTTKLFKKHIVPKPPKPYEPTSLEFQDNPHYWLFEHPNGEEIFKDEEIPWDGEFIRIAFIPREVSRSFKEGIITTLTLVENRLGVLVGVCANQDFSRLIRPRGKHWKGLHALVRGSYDESLLGSDFRDYMNSHKGNPLYAKLGYIPTKIIRHTNKYPELNIPVDVIKEDTLKKKQKT